MATRLLHPPKVTEDPYGAVSPPLYQTATFDQVSRMALPRCNMLKMF